MTTLTLNQELNGIEITFDQKPLQGTLDGLKKLGFRWHRQKKLWYAKQTPERLELAKTIVESVDYAEKVRKEEPKKEAKKENIYGVKVGDTVKTGQIIGRTGTSGLAGGDHLHFGVLVGGVPVQPLEWLDPTWVKNNITSRLNISL